MDNRWLRVLENISGIAFFIGVIGMFLCGMAADVDSLVKCFPVMIIGLLLAAFFEHIADKVEEQEENSTDDGQI